MKLEDALKKYPNAKKKEEAFVKTKLFLGSEVAKAKTVEERQRRLAELTELVDDAKNYDLQTKL